MTAAQAASRERRAAVVREHWDAENRHDPDGVVASFSESRASYDIPAFGPDGQRPDAASVRDLWQGMLASFPDFGIEPGPMLHGDDHIFVEVRVTGTQMGEFAGIPPTGRSIDLPRVANLFEFEGDELVCERVYIDFAEITRQLMPAKTDS
jgi:predicted ester cyclase